MSDTPNSPTSGAASTEAKTATPAKTLSAPPPAGMPAFSDEQKHAIVVRLKRIEGQLRGIQKMVHESTTPDDSARIAQQMSASRSALDKAFFLMLADTLYTQSQKSTNLTDATERAKSVGEILTKFC